MKYEKPDVIICSFENNDIVTLSNVGFETPDDNLDLGGLN